MSIVNWGSTNESLKRLLMYKMQEAMADKGYQQRMDYLTKESDLRRQGQNEYLASSAEKEKQVAEYKHGLDQKKIATELESKLSQEPLIKQLALRWRMAKTPEERAEYEKTLSGVGELFGSAMEDSELGKPISKDKLAAMTMWVDPQTITSILSTSTRSRGQYMTKESADKRLALESHKQDWVERSPETGEKMLGGHKAPRAKETGYNKAVASKAKAILSYVQKQKGGTDFMGNKTEGSIDESTSGILLGLVSEIESRAIQGEYSDKASAKKALDMLDMAYSNPDKILEMAKAKLWYKQNELSREPSALPAEPTIPPGTPTATNPQTGERIAYVNGQWIKIK